MADSFSAKQSTGLVQISKAAVPEAQGVRLCPSKNPSIPHPGRSFYSGQWRTPEGIEAHLERSRRRRARRLDPCLDPNSVYPGRVYFWGQWRTPAQVERTRVLKRIQIENRRARKQKAFVEDVDHRVVLERSEGLCGICGESVDPESFHVDHIVPLARGGEHSYANTQAAHPRCNKSKGAKVDG